MHKQQFFDISLNFASTSLPDILQFLILEGWKRDWKKYIPMKVWTALTIVWVFMKRNNFGVFSWPICYQCTLSLPPESNRKRKVFWCLQGIEKGCIGNKWVNYTKKRYDKIANLYFICGAILQMQDSRKVSSK